MPVMTYAQLQFIKAEAAYRPATRRRRSRRTERRLLAHRLRERAQPRQQPDATQITAAEKAAFLALRRSSDDGGRADAHPDHVPEVHRAVGWGHNELWMDMRRYHYTDVDPASGEQVYPGLRTPTKLYPDNGGKIVQRIRPRYNSEYVWNRPASSHRRPRARLPHEASLDHPTVFGT